MLATNGLCSTMGKMMELTKSNEDYLEAIGLLAGDDGSAQVKEIAAFMKVKMPSVTSAVKQLADMGLVEYVQYAPVRLTEKGRELAQQVIDSHETIHQFLADILLLEPSRACEIACSIEHIMQPDEVARLKSLMMRILEHKNLFGLKKTEKTGKAGHSRHADDGLFSLDQAKKGQNVVIVGISPTLAGINRFADMGLVPGALLTIERSAPLGDPIRVRLRDACLIFRKHEASYIMVRLV